VRHTAETGREPFLSEAKSPARSKREGKKEGERGRERERERERGREREKGGEGTRTDWKRRRKRERDRERKIERTEREGEREQDREGGRERERERERETVNTREKHTSTLIESVTARVRADGPPRGDHSSSSNILAAVHRVRSAVTTRGARYLPSPGYPAGAERAVRVCRVPFEQHVRRVQRSR